VVKSIEAGKLLEETMPVGLANACVLSFDIISSSKVVHPDFHDSVQSVMGKCHEIMMDGYDETKLCANAYRIKELGDGFLCSVGFPYALPHGSSMADLSVTLAQEFAAIFRAEMQKLNYSDQLRCAIGIAQGEVEGFFPLFGVKQYDLRGRPLIHAKRYESLRNIFIANGLDQVSFIIIQEAVYQNLSTAKQSLFKHCDVAQLGITIRDDADATSLYVCHVPCAEAQPLPPHGKATILSSKVS
jgi:class 3 adenylate cyclase